MPNLINITQKGSFDHTEKYLRSVSGNSSKIRPILAKYGPVGVQALSQATPQDTGLTARSWVYDITEQPNYISIRWYNTHVEDGRPIAILLQYGHGTRNGGWVEGRDYIMPAIQPVFDKILADVMKEVTK
jgi:hypothetical protein